MNNAVNNKRVFYVQPHRPIGFGEMLGKRDDIRLDMLEQKSPDAAALEISARPTPIRSAPRATSSARHYHAGAELLGRTPNLLIVSTNGAGYDTVNVQGLHRGRRAGGQPDRRQRRGGRRACARHDAVPDQADVETNHALRSGALEGPHRLYRPRASTAAPSASSASAMSAGASPSSAAACSTCR